ncbi:MAG: ergothioneine biosynthesis protein EgtB [Proteobacteria bacterium]|nr:ergothioneine biosynthesis protein EgtB [Pseudomonadota bacterium]
MKSLHRQYEEVRTASLDLVRDLQLEHVGVQTMPDVSPTKWHLAHVTWFFERFVLEPAGIERLDDEYHYLFNSYYNSAGDMHPRPKRGEIERPAYDEVLDYRARVDERMARAFDAGRIGEAAQQVLVLGLHHEQQHQELMLTDIKHVLAQDPEEPAARSGLETVPDTAGPAGNSAFSEGASGIVRIGHDGGGFAFDNESPAHDALLHPHAIGNRLVTNGEYRAFIAAGGYEDPMLWLSDGWAALNERGWNRPLYWDEALETEFTLGGRRGIDDGAPVTHVSYYEADAFARWAGARLPTEFEWEHAARSEPPDGNLCGRHAWHPVPGKGRQFIGDVWEWTSSAYAPYPGFRPLAGSLGEYNGKFMCNQMTVRGGSCVTPDDHIRPTYRSFFYPDARWQFLGFRLARDAHV